MGSVPRVSDPSGLLSIDTRPDGSLVIKGEIDIHTAPALDSAVRGAIESGSGDVVTDLRAVRFMDSAGLNVFVRAFKTLQPTGRGIVVRGASDAVRRTISVSGVETLVRLED